MKHKSLFFILFLMLSHLWAEDKKDLIDDLNLAIPTEYKVSLMTPVYLTEEEKKEEGEEGNVVGSKLQDFLLKKVKPLETHILSVRERKMLFDNLIASKKKDLIGKYDLSFSTARNAPFDSDSTAFSLVNENLNQDIVRRDYQKELDLLAEITPQDLNIPDSLPILIQTADPSFISFNRKTKQLNPFAPYLIQSQLAIFSTISYYDNISTLTFYAVPANQKPILIWNRATDINNLQEEMNKLSETALPTLLLGRPWSHLIVNTKSTMLTVKLDGEVIGSGKIDYLGAKPGTHTLRIEGLGYTSIEQQVQLEPYKTKEIDIELELNAYFDLITLDTTPQQASVYQGSKWIGETPLEIERREQFIPYTLFLDGYQTRRIDVSKETPDKLLIELQPEAPSTRDIFLSEKNKFYWALGFLTLSLMTTFILSGYQTELVHNYNTTFNDDLINKIDTINAIRQSTYYINAALGLYLGYRTWRLIDAAEKLTK